MFSSATGAPRSLHLLCAIALLLVVPVRSSAQPVGSEAGTVRTASIGGAEDNAIDLKLLVGRSAIVNIGQPIMRISLTRPEIADAMVTGTQQILVHGKSPGTISMFVWNHSGGIKRYDVTVARDLSQLEEQLRTLFPGEAITVSGNGKDVVVAGTVTSKYVIDKAAEVAAGYVDKKEDVVNLLRQQEGIATNQVMLRVRFAEVSRTALTELGASFFTGPGGYKGQGNVGQTATGQFAIPTYSDFLKGNAPPGDGPASQTFSDFLNLFLFNNKYNVGALVHALQSKGLFESLAEPNLVTENGKEASFLAGGEYPYPVVQGTTGALTVTIQFKEFGIRLNFTPTLVGGDLIHLRVKPEVSTLDFANSISYQGFRIPALTTRRADTEVELQDGQTFAIAGLMNNTVTSTMQKIPGIGDIPILGLLFRSKAAQKNQTELVVMITPQILRRGALGAANGLPTLLEPYIGPAKKTYPQPPATLPGSGGAPKQDDNNNVPAPVASKTPVPAPVATRPSAPANVASGPVPGNASSPVSSPVTTAAKPATTAPPPAREAAPVVAAAPPSAVVVSAPVAPAPAPSAAPQSVTVAPGAPARVTVAPAAPAPPKVDEKKLAEERKAAQKAAERKREEDRMAQELAAQRLKQQQEAAGRALARQRELDAQRLQAEAKAAEEKKQAEARAAEEKRQAEARAAEEQRKADIKHAEEQVNAERARLAVAEKQAEEARKQEQKAAKERSKRDSELAKQAADLKKKQDEAEKKRLKEIQDAVERLNAAQSAYQAAVAKK